jgi:hypothetical protein
VGKVAGESEGLEALFHRVDVVGVEPGDGGSEGGVAARFKDHFVLEGMQFRSCAQGGVSDLLIENGIF